jgi:transposase
MERRVRDDGIDAVCAELGKLYDAGNKEALLQLIRHLLSATLNDVDALNGRVAELLQKLYGRKSERIDLNQLILALGEPSQGQVSQSAAEEPKPASEAETEAPKAASHRRTGHRGRGSLPAHLPREEIRLQPTEAQLAVTSGGMKKMSEERSEVLEYEPARFKVLVYVREVWSNAQGEIVTAPAPVKIIDKGLPGPALLAQVVLSKYRDHCPLARQASIYRRQGVELSRNTLVDWVSAVASLFQPLAQRILALALRSYTLQVDDTHLPVQDRRMARNIKRGHLWALVGDHHYVAYRYTDNWRADTVAELLGERVGWMQVDGYKGYERVFALGKAIEVGCWMHARRYFVRAFECRDLRASKPIELIGQLYASEAASRAAGEWPHERLLRRQRLARSVLDALKAWLDEHAGKVPPKSLLGKAITYALNHWKALCRPLEDGMLDIDNGDVERTMRGPAMGRKNWLFAGSDEGAERAAILCTVLESAARHELDLGLYLRDVMLKLASGWPQSRLDELLPHRWRALHAKTAAQAHAQAAQA